MKRVQIRAVEMVRRIRDRHARLLAGKTGEQVIAFFREAGERGRQDPARAKRGRAKPGERRGSSAPVGRARRVGRDRRRSRQTSRISPSRGVLSSIAMGTTRARTPRPRRRKGRALELTAAYVPAAGGGYVVQVLEARGVHAQGDSFEEARANLHDVVVLVLEEAPHQFGVRKSKPLPGALLEKLFVLLPE